MPNRVLSGERIWNSRKIGILKPEHRAEYAWIFPCALANGVFECDPSIVWANCYRKRQDITLEKVRSILDDFANVGLLFRWLDADGSQWGYWTGIHTIDGLLPAPNKVETGHYAVGPNPPEKEFMIYAQKHHLRLNGRGPGATKPEQQNEKERRKQLDDAIRKQNHSL